MRRSIVGTAAFVFGAFALPAGAQQFLGRIGGGCVTLPSTNQHLVSLNAAVPAGATLLVTVAASSTFVSDVQIGDTAGSRYQALGGMRSDAAGALVHFRAALQRPLGAGQTLVVSYGNAGSGVQSCASVLGYRGIPFGMIVQEAIGAAAGHSASPTVSATAASAAVPQLVLSSVATRAPPGSVLAQPPASALPALCSADSSLCLLDAYYLDNGIGPASVRLTLGTSVDWAGALTALYADGIFGNGFD